MSGVWVFGYGSLVSPISFGHTLGRQPIPGADFFEAEIAGYGRRWNYGVMSRRAFSDEADGTSREWTVVALGLVVAPDETVNGVVGWVSDDELVALDHRERNYDRVDVTTLATIAGAEVSRPVMTYVPQEAPRRCYEAARDRGGAAVERRYWDLVDGAFATLGVSQHDRYHRTTPGPDVPTVAMRSDSVPLRHQSHEKEAHR